MNFRDIQYLITVAEQGSFIKADEICKVSQPALSMQIKKIGSHLKIKIFERTSKKILVTHQGEKTVNIARVIARKYNKLLELLFLMSGREDALNDLGSGK